MKKTKRQKLSLAVNGFVGIAYDAPGASETAVIVFTGSDGGLKRSQYIAEKFAGQGIPALALAYFKHPELGGSLKLVPIEYIQRAVWWLMENRGAQKIALYGISKGAEYALSAAAKISMIESVVAVVPNYYVAEGITGRRAPAGDSSWSYQGRALPYLPLQKRWGAVLGASLKRREAFLRVIYDISESQGLQEEAIIPAEQSQARILLLSSTKDNIWNSQRGAEKVMERLKKSNYPYAYEHVSFTHSSHILGVPIPPKKQRLLKIFSSMERHYPKECNDARAKAFQLAVDWISKGSSYRS